MKRFFVFVSTSEVNSGFFYKTAEERDKLVNAERQFIENRVNKLIELKKKLCDGTDKTFVVINQKVRILNSFLLLLRFWDILQSLPEFLNILEEF